MTIIEAIILGIVQGLTEFLPISSSGHLVLLKKVFNISGDFIFFSVILHCATLLAVLLYFKKEVWQIIKQPFGPLAKKLYIATLPAIIVALAFSNFVESTFDGAILPFCFFFTAVLLLTAQLLSSKKAKTEIDYKGSLAMGFMQAIAILPGISRSGSTISGGIIFGYDKEKSAHFSFLMSVPIILASLAYEVLKLVKNGAGKIFPLQTIIASIFAFVFGVLSIKLMLAAVKRLKLHYFSIYLFLLTIASFIIFY